MKPVLQISTKTAGMARIKGVSALEDEGVKVFKSGFWRSIKG
jgi:hypothetical protein